MWNEIAAVQEVLYLLISEPLMNLDAKGRIFPAGRMFDVKWAEQQRTLNIAF